MKCSLQMGIGKPLIEKRVYQGELFREVDFIKTEAFNSDYAVLLQSERNFEGKKMSMAWNKTQFIQLAPGSGLVAFGAKQLIEAMADPKVRVSYSKNFQVVCDQTAFYLALTQDGAKPTGQVDKSKLNFS